MRETRMPCWQSTKNFMFRGLLLFLISWAILLPRVWAGPPFTTDDPEPVEYRHWEIYVASQLEHDKGGWSGTSPHFEIN
jgi:hypothetical protein